VTERTDTTPHPVTVHVFGRTDVGRTREHNEDAFVVADLTADRATLLPEVRTHVCGPLGSLFMVADGMGGAAAGEIASQMATESVLTALRDRWVAAPRHDAESFAAALRVAAESANGTIHDYATRHPENRGMGSTATVAGLLNDTLYVAQVGDSRAYLVRDGVARQLTKDQSLVQRLIDAGELTEEEAEHSDRRNIILQALGPEPMVRIDLTHQRVSRGDVLVLCSDGLSGQVRADEIGRVVGEDADLVSVCKRLIDMANEAGGPDNITVVVARFEGDALTDAAGSDAEAVRHRVFVPESESRPTVPMSAMTDAEIAALPPVELGAGFRSTPPAGDLHVPRITAPVTRAPRGLSLGTWRLVATAVIIAIAAWYVVQWLS
jgi:PPM family protein phosphatase